MKAYRLTAPTSCPFNNGYINPFPFLQRFYENTQTVGVGGSSAAFRGARNQTRCIFLVLLRLCGESKLRERQAHPAGLRIIPFLILFFFFPCSPANRTLHTRHSRRRRHATGAGDVEATRARIIRALALLESARIITCDLGAGKIKVDCESAHGSGWFNQSLLDCTAVRTMGDPPLRAYYQSAAPLLPAAITITRRPPPHCLSRAVTMLL